MIVMPAIDIRKRKCVQLVGGVPGTEQITLENPIDVAIDWEERGAEKLHVIDLDRALGDGENTELVWDVITSVDIPVEVGGGIRDEKYIEKLLAMGAENVIVGTRSVMEPEWFNGVATKYPGKLIAALDARGGEVLINGWKRGSGKRVGAFARTLDATPLAGILFTNVGVEGRLAGIDINPIKELQANTKLQLIISGGITTLEDIKALNRLGIQGCVVGLALYKNTIKLEDALGITSQGG